VPPSELNGEFGRWMAAAGLLEPALCDEIVDVCLTGRALVPSVVGGDLLKEHRLGLVRRLEPSDRTAFLYELLWDLGRLANERYFELELTGIEKSPEYVEYPAGGGHFHWHNDYGLERPLSRRKLTMSIQLSEPGDYEGSGFEVFGIPSPLAKERGTVIALPAFVHHRVTPVTQGTRRALVAWLAGPSLR
jgi:PKHD-type hydroxylase